MDANKKTPPVRRGVELIQLDDADEKLLNAVWAKIAAEGGFSGTDGLEDGAAAETGIEGGLPTLE